MRLTLRTSRASSANARAARSGLSWDEFSIFVYESTGWTLCCTGAIAVEYPDQINPLGLNEHTQVFDDTMQSHKAAMRECQTDIGSNDIYDAFRRASLLHAPTFKAIEAVRGGRGSQATGIVDLHHWKSHQRYCLAEPRLIHPAALDAILQMTFPAYSIDAKNASATTLPTEFRTLWISAGLTNVSTSKVSVHAQVAGRGFRNNTFSVTAALIDSQEL